MPERPEQRYNVGKDPETGEIIRTDKKKRFEQAHGLMDRMIKAAERTAFSTNYLAYHLNLEDDEVAEFMADLPGFSYANDLYSLTDKAALVDYLRQVAGK